MIRYGQFIHSPADARFFRVLEKAAELFVNADYPIIEVEDGDGFRGDVNQLFGIAFLAVQPFLCLSALRDVTNDTLVTINAAVRLIQAHGGDEAVFQLTVAAYENNRRVVDESRLIHLPDQWLPIRHIGIKGGDGRLLAAPIGKC
jgi:hypothetical protein